MTGSNNNDNKHPHELLNPQTLEQLNAYLDGELSAAEQAQVGELLRRSPAAANEMVTLKATRKVLNELPPVPAPRSFAVRPAMLEQPTSPRRGFTLFGWTPSPSFALSLGSVTAACLLVLVLVGQLVSGGVSKNAAQTTAVSAPATSQAYSNPRTDNAPSGSGGPAVLAPTSRSPAPMALLATPTAALLMDTAPAAATTPTTGETTMGAAIGQPTATVGNSANSGANTAPSGAPAPASPPSAFTTLKPPPTATSSGAGYTEGMGSAGNSPASPGYNGNAPSGTTLPLTASPSDQANNPPTGGSSINATGGVPDQNTNQTSNYNVSQGKGADYWLVIEIALAMLTVALGIGALIVQRRSR